MKSLIIGAALLAASSAALAQTNVSISVGQPGFYGRIDLGDAPRPALVYERPVIIQQSPAYVAQPVYLRVPPGHRQHWSRFCGRYNACGRQVYFVTDDWYTRTYVPHYREHYRPEVREYREYRGPERHEYREQRGPERVEYREERGHGHGHDEDRGEGHGEGHGHGHGRGHD
jgi:hypothetical protein